MNNIDVSSYKGLNIQQFKDGSNNQWLYPFNVVYKPSPNDRTHTIKQNDTLQSISKRYYGNEGYWWLLGECNNIIDPFVTLEMGNNLLIPDKSLYV